VPPFVDLGPEFTVVLEQAGDVLSRFRLRVREVAVAAAVICDLAGRMGGSVGGSVGGSAGAGSGAGDPALVTPGPCAGLGLVEGWRGTIAHRVELDAGGRLSRVKVVDPSFFNWPALPVALADTIVPDFPLANKSFNQSYAGNDL